MGVFRGGLLVVFSVLFFLAILVQGFFLTVYFSLDYNSVSPQISSVASDLMDKQELEQQILQNRPMIEVYCKTNSEFTFTDPTTGETMTLPCEDLLGDSDTLVQKQVSKLVEEKYYKEYDCNFFDCIKKTQDPFSLVSGHARDYWKTKYLSFLIVCFVLAGIVFFLVENKSNFFLLTSCLFAVASLVFLKLDVLSGWILKPFFSVGDKLGNLPFSSFLDLFSVFLVRAPVVFVWFLGIAILLFVVWIIMKLFGVGFEISSLIEKLSFKKKQEAQISEEVKKEVEKEVKKTSSVPAKKTSVKKSK